MRHSCNMNLGRLLFWIWLLTLIPDNVLSSDFTEVPQDQKYCLGDQATFTWEYSPKSAVDRIYFLKDGNVFVTHYMAGNTDKKHDPPANRTEVLQAMQTKASIRIQNLTTSDSGRYEILLAGPGSRHTHNIAVLTKADLTPTLKVNNVQQKPDSVIDMDKDQSCNNYPVSVATAKELLANISILLNGEEKEKCTQTRDCVYALDKEYLVSNSNIAIQIDYGVCGVIENELTLIGNNDGSTISTSSPSADVPPDQDTCVACIVVPIVLLVILIAVLAVVWWMRRKHKYCFKDVEKSDIGRVNGNSFQDIVTNQDEENEQTDAEPFLTDPTLSQMTANTGRMNGNSVQYNVTNQDVENEQTEAKSLLTDPTLSQMTANTGRVNGNSFQDNVKDPTNQDGENEQTEVQPLLTDPAFSKMTTTGLSAVKKTDMIAEGNEGLGNSKPSTDITTAPERSPVQVTSDVNEVPDIDTGHPERSTLIQPQQSSDSVTKPDTAKNKKERHQPNRPTVGVPIVHPETGEPHTEAKRQQLTSEGSQAPAVDNSRQNPHPGPNRGTAAADTVDDSMMECLVSAFGTKLDLESGNESDESL